MEEQLLQIKVVLALIGANIVESPFVGTCLAILTLFYVFEVLFFKKKD